MKRRCVPSIVACAAGLACVAGALAQPDAAQSTEPVVRYDGHQIVRVFPQGVKSTAEYRAALAFTDDLWTHTPRVGAPIEMRVSPEQFGRLAVSGLPFEVLVPNLQAVLDAEAAEVRASRENPADDPAWFTSYKNYADVQAYCQNLAATYPNLCQYITVGTSFQNRAIFGLRITGPNATASRPGALYHGCQHAREWVTVPTIVYIAEQLLTKYGVDPAVTNLVNNVDFYLVPIVNPDGYVYTWTTNRLWRKNRQTNAGTSCVGTDNNRNWGFQWGGQGASTDPCNDTYRGSAAFSGKETQVIRDFILSKPNIRAHIDFHAFSQLLMWPWGYTATPPADNATFAAVGANMLAAIEGTFGTNYTAGPVFTTIYPASGGSSDWVYGASSPSARILSYSIELRDTGTFGFQLPASQITPTAEESWRGVVQLSQYVASLGTPSCYANCDGSTAAPALNALDFSCFLTRYVGAEPYANCDGSTAAPVLNALDFSCFLTRYAAGCP